MRSVTRAAVHTVFHCDTAVLLNRIESAFLCELDRRRPQMVSESLINKASASWEDTDGNTVFPQEFSYRSTLSVVIQHQR